MAINIPQKAQFNTSSLPKFSMYCQYVSIRKVCLSWIDVVFIWSHHSGRKSEYNELNKTCLTFTVYIYVFESIVCINNTFRLPVSWFCCLAVHFNWLHAFSYLWIKSILMYFFSFNLLISHILYKWMSHLCVTGGPCSFGFMIICCFFLMPYDWLNEWMIILVFLYFK